ncbi:MAG: S41 family peptidase [Sphingorhabdus sp.]
MKNLVACALAASLFPLPAAADTGLLPEGSWEQRGYSRLVEVKDGKNRFFTIGSTFCYEEKPSEMYILDRIRTHGPNSIGAYQKGQITEYMFDRIDTIPAHCKGKASYESKDPARNFDVFWQLFYENYKFFDLYKVDWQAVYRAQRAKITSETTEEQLWSIMAESLRDVKDGHVGLLRMDGDKEITWSAGRDSSYFRALEKMAAAGKMPKDVMAAGRDEQDVWLEKQVPDYVKKTVLKGKFDTAFNDKLIWGSLPGNIGYVSLTSMGVTEDEGDLPPDVELARLHKAMDEQIMPLMRKQKGVIIDVRFNGGGWDSTALGFASRFSANPKCVAFTKQPPAGKMHAPKQNIYAGDPGAAGPFDKPVVVLTSPESASATEIFLMAARVQPNTRLVGETSEGILSDGWPAYLPNGWMVDLSNEVYIAADGVNYEGKGIPADIPTSVFAGPDLFKNLAPSMQKGLATLKQMPKPDMAHCGNSL